MMSGWNERGSLLLLMLLGISFHSLQVHAALVPPRQDAGISEGDLLDNSRGTVRKQDEINIVSESTSSLPSTDHSRDDATVAVVTARKTQSQRKMTVTLSGYFNITTTVTLKDDSTFFHRNGTLKDQSSIPWKLASGFNFTAAHGPVSATFGGGLGAGGNGDGAASGSGSTSGTEGAGAGGGGNGGSGAGIGMGGSVLLNDKTVVGFGVSDIFAEHGGGGAGTGGLFGGCATGGGAGGGEAGVGRACSGNRLLQASQGEDEGGAKAQDEKQRGLASTLAEVVRSNSTGYGRADGLGSGASSGAAAGHGTVSRARAVGYGTEREGMTTGAAFGVGNGGGAGSSSDGSRGGDGVTSSISDEEAGLYGVGVGVGSAGGGEAGGGSGVAASGGSRAVGESGVEPFRESRGVEGSADGENLEEVERKTRRRRGAAALRVSRKSLEGVKLQKELRELD